MNSRCLSSNRLPNSLGRRSSSSASLPPNTPIILVATLNNFKPVGVVNESNEIRRFQSFLPPHAKSLSLRRQSPRPSTVVLELLVQQHFMRYSKKYKYDAIFALGFVSAFDQILEGFDPSSKEDIFKAYVKSLAENPDTYRKDAAALEKACQEVSGDLDELLSENSNTSNNLLKRSLMQLAENSKDGAFFYTKFFAIGLFRVLELTGFKDPKALERLVSVMNGNLEFVNRDLKLYKNVLTRLSAAKEMMKEVSEREKKKAQEREVAKSNDSKEDVTSETP